jgi:hypothetical protein
LAEKREGIGWGILHFVKRARGMLTMPDIEGVGDLEVDLSDARKALETKGRIDTMMQRISERLDELWRLISYFEDLEERLDRASEQGLSVVPGILKEDKNKLQAEADRLEVLAGQLQEFNQIFADLSRARNEARFLLEHAVLDVNDSCN